MRDSDAGIESLQKVDDPHIKNDTEMHLSTKCLKDLQKDIWFERDQSHCEAFGN